jgi:ATP-binding cassette subfamily B protein
LSEPVGGIVEDGSHNELVDLGGVYASLWNSQVSGFIPD